MIKRLFGLVMLIIGIGGVLVSVAGTFIGYQVIDGVGAGADTALGLTIDSLDNVNDTLVLAKTTVTTVHDSVATVQTTATDLGQTINNTRPLLDQINQVVSEDAPTSLETLQATLPDVAQVASVIDSTLTTLSKFRVDQDFGLFQFKFDLGVNYSPTVPFDESITAIGDSISDLPSKLRSLKVYVNVTSGNLDVISQDIFAVSGDLGNINQRIDETQPILDEYIRIITETTDQIRLVRQGLQDQLGNVKLAILIVMVWLGLTQMAPLYLGWELLTGRRTTTEDSRPHSLPKEDSIQAEEPPAATPHTPEATEKTE